MMNIQELRQSLKMKWLNYYQQNRPWLVKLRVWSSYEGLRRPSSGFILATLSVLEPDFDQVLAFVMELNNNPDEIIAALGLNFNPDKELGLMKLQAELAVNQPAPEYPEAESVELMALTVSDHSPVLAKTEDSEITQQPVLQVVDNHQVVPLEKAMSTAGYTYASPAKINVHPSVRSSSASKALAVTLELPKKDKSVTPLVLTTIKPHKGKVVSSLDITTEVPGKPKTLISSKLVTKISQNGHELNPAAPQPAQKVHPRPHTNASNLASWIDEFCLGTEWDSEEAVSM